MPYKDPADEREYQKLWHKRTWEKRKKEHVAKQKARRQRLALWFRQYKKNLSCDCGEGHPACLDFHHTQDDKVANVSDMVGRGLSQTTILAEIAKCVVICKNCHAKKHYRD